MPGDRISIFASGKETVLAELDDIVNEGTDAEAAIEIQPVRYFRGEKVRFIDRRNEAIRLTFTVTREWRDDVEAFNRWITCRANTPRSGNITWLTKNGSTRLSRYLVDCVVQVRPVQRFGSVTILQYIITGGQISTSPPTEAAA